MANTFEAPAHGDEYWDILDGNRNKTGGLHKRGDTKPVGVYHLVVHVWILGSDGKFLLSKRSPHKPYPNLWECTAGSAIAGDDSITTVLKEAREELGIELEVSRGELFNSYKHTDEDGSGSFVDVWVFKQDFELSQIVLQEGETSDVMTASANEIRQMTSDGVFIFCGNERYFSYFDDMTERLAI